MRTRASVCRRKTRFAALADAMRVAARADVPLRPYRCERCRQYHLTGRTKGKWVSFGCKVSDAADIFDVMLNTWQRSTESA